MWKIMIDPIEPLDTVWFSYNDLSLTNKKKISYYLAEDLEAYVYGGRPLTGYVLSTKEGEAEVIMTSVDPVTGRIAKVVMLVPTYILRLFERPHIDLSKFIL